MTASNTTTTTTTTTPTLTGTQARALLQALLSTNPSTPRRFVPAIPKPTGLSQSQQQKANRQRSALLLPRRQPQPQAHTITIDASTRIMGHCNLVRVASPPPADHAVHIEKLMRGALADAPKGTSVVVQAGINVMGSRNTVTLGREGLRKEDQKFEAEPKRGSKRRAEDSVNIDEAVTDKRVKIERQEKGLKE